jgi:hypothetical protein
MLGPLPVLYRWIVCGLAVVASVGVCSWLALTLSAPTVASVRAVSGAALGAVLGTLVVTLLLHESHAVRHRARRTR